MHAERGVVAARSALPMRALSVLALILLCFGVGRLLSAAGFVGNTPVVRGGPYPSQWLLSLPPRPFFPRLLSLPPRPLFAAVSAAATFHSSGEDELITDPPRSGSVDVGMHACTNNETRSTWDERMTAPVIIEPNMPPADTIRT